MQLRDYQSRSIEQLYEWMSNNKGHPCVVLPTGSGKSVVIAEFIRKAIQEWPETTALMLCHQKELIEQNAEKMRAIWPGAPMGIYSASVGKKQLGEPILFAGIQSIRNKAQQVGHIDICIVDECHCISHKDEGGYRKFLNELLIINPSMRIIGYSATPYRLGHGLITDKPALFDDLIEPVSIEELIRKGHLSKLRSKITTSQLNVDGVHKRGGEYIEAELQAAVNTDVNNTAAVKEVLRLAGDRKAWLFFCAGVKHAEAVAETLNAYGVGAACITGETPKAERELLLKQYKAGQITALTNANVLTTGFDYPDIDLIAMLRPTMSASLYVQMAGRGLRPKSHTDHCLVLDFAGVVSMHGPITNVQPPKKGGSGNGEAPVKVCDACNELCPISALKCPACGNLFPPPAKKSLTLHLDDIMGVQGLEMNVRAWAWRKHTSKASGKEMLAVTYYGGLSEPTVTEYLAVMHEGYAGQKAAMLFVTMAKNAGVDSKPVGLDEAVSAMRDSKPPRLIEYKREGKFFKILRREWNETESTTVSY
jgi:DNA repair protein RadD